MIYVAGEKRPRDGKVNVFTFKFDSHVVSLVVQKIKHLSLSISDKEQVLL